MKSIQIIAIFVSSNSKLSIRINYDDFGNNQAQKEWLSDKAKILLRSLVNPPKSSITIDQLRLKLAELNNESVSNT